MSNRRERLLDMLESDGRRIHVLLTRLTLCESTAEDLMQDLFIRLSTSESFDRARDRTAYAIRSATNLAFEWRRKQERTVNSHTLMDEPIARGMSPSDLLEQHEQCASVLQALDGMSELSRQVIVLHRLQGESYEAPGNVKEEGPLRLVDVITRHINADHDNLKTVLFTAPH